MLSSRRVALRTCSSWTVRRVERRDSCSVLAALRRVDAVFWAWRCLVRSFEASAWEKNVSSATLNYIVSSASGRKYGFEIEEGGGWTDMGWFERDEIVIYWFCGAYLLGRDCSDVAFDVG
jgi:hypothetical protein